MEMRVANLRTAAAKFGVKFPEGYEALFLPEANPPLSDADEFFVSVADAALTSVLPTLIERADKIVKATPLPAQSETEVLKIYKRFRQLVPDEDAKCLADVLNAGWMAYADADLWSELTHLKPRRNEILRDLVLKNLELIETRLRTHPQGGRE